MNGRLPARISQRNRPLRWLVQPSREVRMSARPVLLGKLLLAPIAIFVGALNCLAMTVAAAVYTGHRAYFIIAAMELVLLAARATDIRRVRREREMGRVPRIDGSVMLSICWSALQGTLALIVMTSGEATLMIVSAVMVMSLIGPLCARNYAAPRLAMLLVCLCVLPFVAGAVLSGRPLLLMLVPMTPTFMLGVDQIIRSFHHTLAETLQAEQQNRFQARHDALTGLLNRFGLDDVMEQLPGATGQAVAVLCIDLDGFKQVNDRHGHAAGDSMLEQVAVRLRATLRGDDAIARLGGDEFMVVVRNRRPAEVGMIADRLIARIAEEPYPLANGTTARVGASVGYACFPEDALDPAALRTRADQALYAAKAGGKGIGRRFAEVPLLVAG